MHPSPESALSHAAIEIAFGFAFFFPGNPSILSLPESTLFWTLCSCCFMGISPHELTFGSQMPPHLVNP
jgi:hypothetical protein